MIAALFLIAGIHSATNIKYREKQKKLFKPANVQSSFEESFNEKRKMFIGMCSFFTWLKMLAMNLCHK